jgi:hypothetical protein
VRIEALARRPADGLRRVADPIVFAVATLLITHAIWKAYALPEAGLSFVIELAYSSFALSRITAIARLARLYRVTADVDVSRRVTDLSRGTGTGAWAIASAPTYADAATSVARPSRRQPAVRRRHGRPEEGDRLRDGLGWQTVSPVHPAPRVPTGSTAAPRRAGR